MAKTTVIEFDQFGGMKVDHEGFVGTQCEEATKNLIGNIGGRVTRDVKKPEYNMRQSAGAKQSTGRGW